MKKRIFSRLMTVVMMTAMCVTLTACGGDDGDSTPGKPDGPSGATGSTEYVTPCLDFGSSVAHVKEYMSGTIWQLNENSNDAVLLYTNNQATTVVNYMFINSKLHMTTVTYNGGGESKANAFKAEIEKLYGVTMARENDPDNPAQFVYHCTVTINQKSVVIMMTCYAQGINILYSLPD